MRLAKAAAHERTLELFIKNKACGATVVVGRVPWLTSGSGASNACIAGTSWLRLTVK